MKVLLTIWITVVLIQEVVPSTLVRLPRHAANPKASIHTEYEAKYAQKGKHGNESFSLVKGNQEFHHDNCGENWNDFAEKCATLIKELIGSLANVVSSKPGDATNLQLHIKNSFKHFDSSHNCSCFNCTGNGLSNLDLSSLFNNITIETSPENAALACKDLSNAIHCKSNGASPSNTNPLQPGINPADVEGHGDATNNNRRQTPNGVLNPILGTDPKTGLPVNSASPGQTSPLFPVNTNSPIESLPESSAPSVVAPKGTPDVDVFGPFTLPPPPTASQTTPIKLMEEEAKPFILPPPGGISPHPQDFSAINPIGSSNPAQPSAVGHLPGIVPTADTKSSDDCEEDNNKLSPIALPTDSKSPDDCEEESGKALPAAINPISGLNPGQPKEGDPKLGLAPGGVPSTDSKSPDDCEEDNSKTLPAAINPIVSSNPGQPSKLGSVPEIVPSTNSKSPDDCEENNGKVVEIAPSVDSKSPDDCDDDEKKTPTGVLNPSEVIPGGLQPNQAPETKPSGPDLNDATLPFVFPPFLKPPKPYPSAPENSNFDKLKGNEPEIGHAKPGSGQSLVPVPIQTPPKSGLNPPNEIYHGPAPTNSNPLEAANQQTLAPPHGLPGLAPQVNSGSPGKESSNPDDCDDDKSPTSPGPLPGSEGQPNHQGIISPSIVPPPDDQLYNPEIVSPSIGGLPSQMGPAKYPGIVAPNGEGAPTILPPHTSQPKFPEGPAIMPPHVDPSTTPGAGSLPEGHIPTVMPPHAGQANIPGAIPSLEGSVPSAMPPHVGKPIIPGADPLVHNPTNSIMPPHVNQGNFPGVAPAPEGQAPIMPPFDGQSQIPGPAPLPTGQPPVMPPQHGEPNIPGSTLPSEGSSPSVVPPQGGQPNNLGVIPAVEGNAPTIVPTPMDKPNIPGATSLVDELSPIMPQPSGQPNNPGAIPPIGNPALPVLPSQGGQPNIPGAFPIPEGQTPIIPGAPTSPTGEAPIIPGVSKEPINPSVGGTQPTTSSSPLPGVVPVSEPGKLGQPGTEGVNNAQDPAVLASEDDCESPDSMKGDDIAPHKPQTIPQGVDNAFVPQVTSDKPGLIMPPVDPNKAAGPGMIPTGVEPPIGVLDPSKIHPSVLSPKDPHSSDKKGEDCEDDKKDSTGASSGLPNGVTAEIMPALTPPASTPAKPDSLLPQILLGNEPSIPNGEGLGPAGQSILPPGLNSPDLVSSGVPLPGQHPGAVLPPAESHSKDPASPDNIFKPIGLPGIHQPGAANPQEPAAAIESPLGQHPVTGLPPINPQGTDNKEDCEDDTPSVSGNKGTAPLGLTDHINPQTHGSASAPLTPSGPAVPIPVTPESPHIMHIGKPTTPKDVLSPDTSKPSPVHPEGGPGAPGTIMDPAHQTTSHPPLFVPEGTHPVFGPVNQRPVKIPGSTPHHKTDDTVTPAPIDSNNQLVKPNVYPGLDPILPHVLEGTIPGGFPESANHGELPKDLGVAGKPDNQLIAPSGPNAPGVPSDSYSPVVSGTKPTTPPKVPVPDHPTTGTTYPNYDETSVKPTTFQTTSVEPTPPQINNHIPPPLLTIPYHQTTSPQTPYDANHPIRPSPTIFPTHKEPLEDDEDDEEDCCSCEACEEGENNSPKEYRVAVCKDLEEARKELKAIFDKIRKKLKCGRKTIKTFGPV